ncbi:hypothetical protein XTGART2_0229 [Xanthomonas translucens pv. graminis]|jgi:hypothetical protein|uniref:Uncharacterized protein n=1 Tax=Xanthomonas graminis pv. graminis TaxID=134874 RepID=A0A1M4I9B4_9XANT|nr:hypothetical protein XTG29_00123 [Xanthomonas translucens pv. graminis ART-Xtg29]SBV38916.1 hypothetical protein XTGART2_0229 [Xanthomonas translucens pv. graminis]SBV38928.1 hypothetical protein XTGART9_0232 [Xanthomonas translucens pv. graminis]SBV45637.1 hypothetical protein XTGART29_0250 [Xanthomonas translucens pv. graminis ART-Xtg29]SBV53629.1 hypothetical protein XTGART10_0230 [Xanthomonas translucens pv. graminis]
MNPTPLLSRRWPQRLLLAALLALAASPALAEPPSDGDINRLLSASRAQNMLDSMLPQIEAMQRQQFAQLTAQRPLDAAQQRKCSRSSSAPRPRCARRCRGRKCARCT